MQTLIKYLVILALIALPVYGVIALFGWMIRSAQESTYPDNPVATVQQFFTCLQEKPDGDYLRCRQLLHSQIKIPTLVNLNTMDFFDRHFDRIRNYLQKRVGDNFASAPRIVPDGPFATATFDETIVLRFVLDDVRGSDGKTCYAIRQILEFPIDVMPGLGVESRNRILNQTMETGEGLVQPTEVDDSAEVLRLRTNESPAQRLQRLVGSYFFAPQLDTRHDILDAVLKEFPGESATRDLLEKIARNENEALHLRQLAQKILDGGTC